MIQTDTDVELKAASSWIFFSLSCVWPYFSSFLSTALESPPVTDFGYREGQVTDSYIPAGGAQGTLADLLSWSICHRFNFFSTWGTAFALCCLQLWLYICSEATHSPLCPFGSFSGLFSEAAKAQVRGSVMEQLPTEKKIPWPTSRWFFTWSRPWGRGLRCFYF